MPQNFSKNGKMHKQKVSLLFIYLQKSLHQAWDRLLHEDACLFFEMVSFLTISYPFFIFQGTDGQWR